MFFIFLLLALGCTEGKVIVREGCDGDGSGVPNCREYLTPELDGLSFYLPHEFSMEILGKTQHTKCVTV